MMESGQTIDREKMSKFVDLVDAWERTRRSVATSETINHTPQCSPPDGPLDSSPPCNPLWLAPKIKNYLPHMTHPEVSDLLSRTDLAIIPVPSMEQHGPQGPLGTDFLNGVAQAQLIAQETDALVVPVLMAGNSPYHLGFKGTISLPTALIQEVYFEAMKSLLHHGVRKFAILNAHGGNAATTTFLVDRINQETPGVAVDLLEAMQTFDEPGDHEPLRPHSYPVAEGSDGAVFDRHAGIGETSMSLYLIPSLVQMDQAPGPSKLTLPAHLRAMMPRIVKGDPTAELLFLAEALKAEETGKHTSTREMSRTGCWSEADVRTASAERGKVFVDRVVKAAVGFLEEWKRLVPMRSDQEKDLTI